MPDAPSRRFLPLVAPLRPTRDTSTAGLARRPSAFVVAGVFVAAALWAPVDAHAPVDTGGPAGPVLDAGTWSGTCAPVEHALPEAPTGFEPVWSMPGSSFSASVVDGPRHLLYWVGNDDDSGGASDLIVMDVCDPQHPDVLAELADFATVGDGVFDHVLWNGQHLLTVPYNHGIAVIDVTDPGSPAVVAMADEWGAHTLAAVPGTPYVYAASSIMLNHDSQGGHLDRVIPVLDLSAPTEPVWHTFDIPLLVSGVPVTSDGCHAISVRVDLGRAFCAGGSDWYGAGGGETFIWDITTDPLHPAWIGIIDDPRIVYHHAAIASEDGDHLYVSDEIITVNACFNAKTAAGDVGVPVGALWVYRITDPGAPRLTGYVQADDPWLDETRPGIWCGAHFGDLVDGTDLLVWGWYGGGTALIDVGDPGAPAVLDQYSSEWLENSWSATYWNGHAFHAGGAFTALRIV